MHFQGQIKIIGMQASIVASFAPWSCGMIYLLTFSGCELASLLVHGALEEVDDALERQDAQALYRALQDPILTLRCLQRDNLDCYLEQLSMDRQQKALVKAGRSLQAWGTHAGVAPQDCNGPQEEGASPRAGVCSVDQQLSARGLSVAALSAQADSGVTTEDPLSAHCRSWATWTCWSRRSWRQESSW